MIIIITKYCIGVVCKSMKNATCSLNCCYSYINHSHLYLKSEHRSTKTMKTVLYTLYKNDAQMRTIVSSGIRICVSSVNDLTSTTRNKLFKFDGSVAEY